jgi:hypothetical protein
MNLTTTNDVTFEKTSNYKNTHLAKHTLAKKTKKQSTNGESLN